jgi:hypothetical protein
MAMRLKVKKLLKGGEYFVTLENVDFNFDETEKIEKFGMPTIDFSMDGLGSHKLNEMNLSFEARSAEEAEEMVSRVQYCIKDKLSELLSKVDNFTGEEVIEL